MKKWLVILLLVLLPLIVSAIPSDDLNFIAINDTYLSVKQILTHYKVDKRYAYETLRMFPRYRIKYLPKYLRTYYPFLSLLYELNPSQNTAAGIYLGIANKAGLYQRKHL